MPFYFNTIKSIFIFLLLVGQGIYARSLQDSITVRLNIVTDNRDYYES